MDLGRLALFAAGVFFGGAIDHVILAVMGRGQTPYGLGVGVAGNWALAVFDGVLTAVLIWIHRRRA